MGYALPVATQQLAVTDAYPEAVQAGVFFQHHEVGLSRVRGPGRGASQQSRRGGVVHRVLLVPLPASHPLRPPGRRLLLCLSTVYCRYHYLVDVLAGLLTAAALVPLGNWLYFKFRRPDLEGPLSGAGQTKDERRMTNPAVT